MHFYFLFFWVKRDFFRGWEGLEEAIGKEGFEHGYFGDGYVFNEGLNYVGNIHWIMHGNKTYQIV